MDLLNFFVVGSIFFWLVLTLFSISVIVCLKDEKEGPHGFIVFGTLIFLGLNIKNFNFFHWKDWVLIGTLYLVAGAIWSVIELFLFAKKVVNNPESYISRYNKGSISKEDIKEYLNPSRHKANITAWIAYWPWCMFWTLTRDLFNSIYNALSGVYKRVVDKAVQSF